MPLAFSTLGCPHVPVGEVVAIAERHRIDGIELRAAEDSFVHTGLSGPDRSAIRRSLEDAGVQALALDSYIRVRAAGDEREFAAALDAHADLAADLGCTYLRVFPGGEPDDPDGDRRAVARFATAAREIAARGVHLALETHDSRPRGRDVASILDPVNRALPADVAVNAIWDVLHPWRAGEDVGATAAELADHLAYIQVKDAEPGQSGALTLIGHGAVPLDDVVRAATAIGRGPEDAWYSLEWERAWHPQLPDLDVALGSLRAWWDREDWRCAER